jgi:hypothetical protein
MKKKVLSKVSRPSNKIVFLYLIPAIDLCTAPIAKKNREAWKIEENLKLQRTDALWFIHYLCLVLLVLNYDQM